MKNISGKRKLHSITAEIVMSRLSKILSNVEELRSTT